MTDKTREEIAQILLSIYGTTTHQGRVTTDETYAANRILAIPEIKEGQELRRRELAKSRGKCPCLCHTGEPVFHAPACCNQVNKPLASGESR